MKKRVKILAIIGKSGSGKDSLMEKIKEANLKNVNIIVGTTTRPPREGEVDGIDYHFVSYEKFLTLLNTLQIADVSSFNNWHYGTQISDLKGDGVINIGIFDPARIMSLSSQSHVSLCAIIIEASDKERLLRQLTREEEPDVKEILRRFWSDENDFEDLNGPFSKVHIFNHDGQLDEAYNKILNIVAAWDENG